MQESCCLSCPSTTASHFQFLVKAVPNYEPRTLSLGCPCQSRFARHWQPVGHLTQSNSPYSVVPSPSTREQRICQDLALLCNGLAAIIYSGSVVPLQVQTSTTTSSSSPLSYLPQYPSVVRLLITAMIVGGCWVGMGQYLSMASFYYLLS